MNEKQKITINLPFSFNNDYHRKFPFKVLSPNKNLSLLYNNKNNSNHRKSNENDYSNDKKRNIKESFSITKSALKYYFPPVLRRNIEAIKKIDTPKKLNGIDNYMINGFKKDKNHLLDLTKKIDLKGIIRKHNFKNENQYNFKNFSLSSKNEENKINYTSLKVNAIQLPFKYDSISITTKYNNSRKLYSNLKMIERKEHFINLKLTKSYDKNISRNTNKNEINENNEQHENNKRNYYFRRTYRYNSNKIYEKRKVMYKYCVYPGNNTKLIDIVMKHRSDVWEKVSTTHFRFCDLVWAPLSSSIDFKTSQCMHSYVNHIPLNEEISNKMRLYANLIQHCEKKKIDVYKIFPFTICLTLSHYTCDEQINNFVNLFKDINIYTPKSNIFFSKLFNALLNRKIGSKQTINIPKTFNSGKNMWIIKPVNLNRGRCIKVLNNLNDILKEIKLIQYSRKIQISDNNSHQINHNNNYKTINVANRNNSPEKDQHNSIGIKCEYIMIQKYLEKPLLYQGRKFDIRIWVMFISNRENEIFIFKEGHLKAASLKYNPDSDDLFIHLTNYSVQKYHSNFSENEIGNEIPFYDFQHELDKNNSSKNFRKDIYPKIVKIIRLTGGGAKNGKMNFMNLKNCFEIFGYDFILDEDYNPYLLEINSNPGLEFSSPLIKQLLPRMIDDAFKLTIDEEYSLSNIFIHKESKFPVDYYNNNENMWERYTIL